jgi:Fe-Mn family superoxide dismutase
MRFNDLYNTTPALQNSTYEESLQEKLVKHLGNLEISILESKRETLQLEKLPYGRSDLAPAISKATIDYHFGELAQSYVTRFNKGEGDNDFNHAGAFLHNTLFSQYQKPSSKNNPTGPAAEFITEHFDTYEKFKDEFSKEAMGIQGSGWVYLARNGTIKTITNHKIKNDIILLIDWWGHAWALDYQSDKAKYLENQWKIINWNVVSGRLGLDN